MSNSSPSLEAATPFALVEEFVGKLLMIFFFFHLVIKFWF